MLMLFNKFNCAEQVQKEKMSKQDFYELHTLKAISAIFLQCFKRLA